jgi:hypothetical protein
MGKNKRVSAEFLLKLAVLKFEEELKKFYMGDEGIYPISLIRFEISNKK